LVNVDNISPMLTLFRRFVNFAVNVSAVRANSRPYTAGKLTALLQTADPLTKFNESFF